jgi:hypothetical protein
MRSTIPYFVLALVAAAPAIGAETVSVPAFRSIELRGGGQVIVRPGPVQRVTLIEGSGRITRFQVVRDGRLEVDLCNGRCPPNYRLRAEIQAPQVPDLAIQGGGLIQVVHGFAPQRRLSVAVSGGGKIDAQTVEAGSVSAAVQGGGWIGVRPRSALSAAVNGGGEIRYAGNPQVSSAINGGGAVRRIN